MHSVHSINKKCLNKLYAVRNLTCDYGNNISEHVDHHFLGALLLRTAVSLTTDPQSHADIRYILIL